MDFISFNFLDSERFLRETQEVRCGEASRCYRIGIYLTGRAPSGMGYRIDTSATKKPQLLLHCILRKCWDSVTYCDFF